jgi:hypothetical protein
LIGAAAVDVVDASTNSEPIYSDALRAATHRLLKLEQILRDAGLQTTSPFCQTLGILLKPGAGIQTRVWTDSQRGAEN